MKTQHDPRFHFAFFVGRLVLRIRFANQRQHCAIDPGARLNHVRNKFLFGVLVEILERFSARLLMLRQIVIGSVGDAFQFLPPERKIVFDVVRPF